MAALIPLTSLPHKQRKNILRKHRCDAELSLEATAKWVRNRVKRSIAKSTVSESLPTKWAWIDSTSVNHKVKPNYAPKWPLLRKLLFEWQLEQESRDQSPTTKTLMWAGRKIWDTPPGEAKVDPETKNTVEESSFSPRWLSRFKKRHKTSWRRKYGEAASVPETAHEEMKRVRLIAKDYLLDSLYNLDEGGLYRRRGSAKGLSKALLPRPKAEKSRISTNADGSGKHPPHFIEEREREREFSRFQRDGKEKFKMGMDIEQESSSELQKFGRRAIGVVAKEMDASLIQQTFGDFDTQTHNNDTDHSIINLVSAERQRSDIGLQLQMVAARQMSLRDTMVISQDDESHQNEESDSTLSLVCTDDKHSTSISSKASEEEDST
ncbi:hypothetical protein OXX79_006933 [Metschnikowia pulcherrima]